MKNLGILLSGRGSNFVAIADSLAAGRIPNARIAVVISNRADAPGLEIARQRGLNALAVSYTHLDVYKRQVLEHLLMMAGKTF